MSVAAEQGASHDVSRLVARAREQGEPDVFPGKRRWPRYRLNMRLEVTTDINSPSKRLAVTMHNVSGGGIGLWSKERFSTGSALWVREWSSDENAEWVPAHVTHSSLGIGGYLIGAAFDQPSPAQKLPEPDEAARGSTQSKRDATSSQDRGPRRSLQAKCASASAIASAAATLIAFVNYWTMPPEQQIPWLAGLAVAIAAATGGVAAWLLLNNHTRFLRRLRAQIRSMAKGAPEEPVLDPAPSSELAAIRQAVVELESEWRKREHAGLAQRARLEELNLIKSNILNMVSHDLRTPLTSILLYAEMLREELDTLDAADRQHFLEIISSECKRLSHLVGDLLEAQRMESGRARFQMRPLDISRTIAACALVFQAMARSKSIELIVECPESLPHIEADGDKIAQVMSNLVSNAIKYSPSGSTVRISAEEQGREIVICVADNGTGIPRDKWDQIFDRFSQVSVSFIREIPGVGLGLYIVRQIIEHHGGRVWVDSEVGRGTEFYAALPVEAPETHKQASSPDTPARGRVVVCDADPELANRIGQMVRERGFEVRLAYSGCRLLAHLNQVKIDAVVTDVLLPDMDTADLLDALADIPDRSFRVIAHTYVSNGSQLRSRGVDIYLERPAQKDELLQAVEVAMKKRSTALTVLLVTGPNTDVHQLAQLLSERGDTPLVTRSLESAAKLIRDYPIDRILIADQALTADWSELRELRPELREMTRVFVLCEDINKKQRRLANELGVCAIQNHTDREGEVVAAITKPISELEPVP